MLELILKEHNPHWSKENFLRKGLINRPNYIHQLVHLQHRPEIVVIKGIRRSGKSSLLALYIHHLIQQGVPKENICFVNVEDYRLAEFLHPQGMDTVLQTYIQLQNPKGKIYVFVDEIQRVQHFEQWLRTRYELSPEIKFVVSGSTAHIFSREMATLLTGRHLSIEVFPFSFDEFIEIKMPGLINNLKSSFRKEIWGDETLVKRINTYLKQYLHYGGFPEIVKRPFNTDSILLLQQYFQDILLKDVAIRYNIRKVSAVLELARYLISNTSNEIKIARIAKLLNMHRVTVQELIEYYTEVYLFFFTSNFSFSLNERLNTKKPRKVYCVDNGFYSALSATQTEDTGRLMENLIFQQLKFRWKEEVFYWKEKIEIDFVLSNGLPVNVTYGPTIPERELIGLFYYLEKFNLTKGILITRNQFEEIREGNRKVQVVPAWYFLLIPDKGDLLSDG